MAAPNLFVPYILGLFFYFSTLVVYPSSACDLVDCSALLAVKSSITSDSSGLLSTRNASTDDCCKWDGVTCDPSTGHVVNLTRPGLGDRPDDFPLDTSMSGTISPSIDDLTHLHVLDLSNLKEFTSPIPPSLSCLASLGFWKFNSNFTGLHVP
ncbi:DNA damage-repair/toleration protein DRT100-like [Asparagus officinalis]|uniref:DNA damage-repair/toleration protein DRT100-like n=1 Tax=Asparagus officinalis TaxID=4686 RepID=UPI00098E403F|nr:DNA damage-repair/toleration protein DRT100-like [Asparagus officinalis]